MNALHTIAVAKVPVSILKGVTIANVIQGTLKMAQREQTLMNALHITVVAMGPVLIQVAVIIVNVTQVTIRAIQLVLIEMNVVMELMTVGQTLFARTPTVDTLALANTVTVVMV